MVRQASKILTAAEQKVVDTTSILKAQIKTEQAAVRTALTANKVTVGALTKAEKALAKSKAALDKISTPKVAATAPVTFGATTKQAAVA